MEHNSLAKIYFIGHSGLARSHQVQPIGLNKLEYCGKEF